MLLILALTPFCAFKVTNIIEETIEEMIEEMIEEATIVIIEETTEEMIGEGITVTTEIIEIIETQEIPEMLEDKTLEMIEEILREMSQEEMTEEMIEETIEETAAEIERIAQVISTLRPLQGKIAEIDPMTAEERIELMTLQEEVAVEELIVTICLPKSILDFIKS